MTFRTTLAAALLLVPVVATADPETSTPATRDDAGGPYGARHCVLQHVDGGNGVLAHRGQLRRFVS